MACLLLVDGPKFIDCAPAADSADAVMLIHRRAYEQRVHIDCSIQAQPAVDHVTVDWSLARLHSSSSRRVSLSAGQRDGHHLLLLLASNTSVRTPPPPH